MPEELAVLNAAVTLYHNTLLGEPRAVELPRPVAVSMRPPSSVAVWVTHRAINSRRTSDGIGCQLDQRCASGC